MPKLMRKELTSLYVHDGNPEVGIVSGYNLLVIHNGTADEYISDGFFDEALLQNFVHVGLDANVDTDEWDTAAALDDIYVSDYARDYALEDVSQTYVVWFATRQR